MRSWLFTSALAWVIVSIAHASSPAVVVRAGSRVAIPGGKFTPLFGFGKKGKTEYTLSPFYMDRAPVTRERFLAFVAKNPQWSKKSADPLYVDEQYLRSSFPVEKKKTKSKNIGKFPMTNVSWFAADAFCESQGGRLPKVLEWEYVAAASVTKADASRDASHVDKILAWYSKPGSVQGNDEIEKGIPNFYGVHDLHGLIWEWTWDFNSVFVSGDNRQDGDKSAAMVCGGGATDATSRADYAAFMRYAMRSAVDARFSQPNLGFRCVYDKKD